MGKKIPKTRPAAGSSTDDAATAGSASAQGAAAAAAGGCGSGPLKVKRTRKSVPRDSPMQRSSAYRGVTRHRWTGRFEAHLWDKNCWNESQNKKGRQVYLGAYDDEEAAAHAYDLAALKYWGPDTILNFPLPTYQQELKEMDGQSREEYIGSLRRKSSGFSRGVSKYRGVARHHHNGRWEARIGRVFGNKYLYLGTYATQEEAAMAYDMAAIEYRGLNAVTNFDLSRYINWFRPTPGGGGGEGVVAFPHPEGRCDSNASFLGVDHNQVLAHGMGLDLRAQPQIVVTGPESAAVPITADSQVIRSQWGGARGAASSALGLLFQPSKFKEMPGETTATADSDDTSASTPPGSSPSSEDDAACAAARCSFPDDIQTYFECHNDDDIIFGDLTDFTSTIFDCELDC